MEDKDLAKYYEDIVTKENIDYPNIKNGLNLTKQFIIDNELILIGGMAIDLALKSTGSEGIYDNTKLPDYDFLSSNSIKHSSELAVMLCKLGITPISDISALHVTTRRVRINSVSVADIGYCPQSILEKIKYIEYEGLRIIHPHYQMIDIHHSLSFPFENPMYPVIIHRWKRDMLRYDLLFEAFPLVDEQSKLKWIDVDILPLKGACITGWAAFSYWKNGTYKVPIGEPIHILTDDFNYYIGISETPAIYVQSLFGKLPRHVKVTINGIVCEVYDNLGENVSAEKIESHYVANIQHCMMIFLTKKYLDTNSSPEICDEYIASYLECAELVKKGDRPGILPSINIYGRKTWSDAYIIGRRDFAARLMNTKPDNVDRPGNGYPKSPNCITNVTFDYDGSNYFELSGKVTNTFLPKTIEFFGVTDIISIDSKKC
jgi:hypothetical protein